MTLEAFPDFYSLLRVQPDASEAELRRAYLIEVKFWHPDKFVGRPATDLERSARMTAQLAEAYNTLRNSDARQAYDELRAEWLRASRILAIVVCPRGSGNYTSISEAILYAPDGALILLRPGEYNEGLVIERPLTLVASGLTEATIVRADDSPCIRLECEEASLRGLTLRGRTKPAVFISQGSLTLEGCDIASQSQTASVLAGGPTADLTLEHCRIHSGGGHGVFLGQKASARMKDCAIFGNARAGVRVTQGAKAEISDSKIRDNRGEGIYIDDYAIGLINGTHIFSNHLSGVKIATEANASVSRCSIYDGKTEGVTMFMNAVGRFEDCEVYCNNKVEMHIRQASTPMIRRCKVRSPNGYAVYLGKSVKAVFEDCEITGERGRALVQLGRGSSIRGCKIQETAFVHGAKTSGDNDHAQAQNASPPGSKKADGDLLQLLSSKKLEVIDKRRVGGALWVVGGSELSALMKELSPRGFRFSFAKTGSASTRRRPAWWLKT